MAKTDSPAGNDALWLAFTGIAPIVLCASAWLRGGSISALALAGVLLFCFLRYEPSPDFELKRTLFLFRKALPPAEDGSSREFGIRFGGLRFDGEGNVYSRDVPWSGIVVDWPDRRVWARGFGVALQAGRTLYAGSGIGPFCWGVVQTLPAGRRHEKSADGVTPERVAAVKPRPVDPEKAQELRAAPLKAASGACARAAKAGAAALQAAAKICAEKAEKAADRIAGDAPKKPAGDAGKDAGRQQEGGGRKA